MVTHSSLMELSSLLVELWGKVVEIEVGVVNARLNNKIMLGCSCTYAMGVVVSSLYGVTKFPHEGKFVTINQLS